MRNIVSKLILRYASNLQMFETGNRINFKFPYNDELRLGLKEFGARWDRDNRVWFLSKNAPELPDAINFYHQFKEVFNEKSPLQDRGSFPVEGLPFIHKDIAKDKGGRWNRETKKWEMPSLELKQQVEDISASLHLEVDPEYADDAKFYGKWDGNKRQWVMYNPESKANFLEAIAKKKSQSQQYKSMYEKIRSNIIKERNHAREEAVMMGYDPNTLRQSQGFSEAYPSNQILPTVGKEEKDIRGWQKVIYVGEPLPFREGKNTFKIRLDSGWVWNYWSVPIELKTDDTRKLLDLMPKGKAINVLEKLRLLFREIGREAVRAKNLSGEILAPQMSWDGETMFVLEGSSIWLLTRDLHETLDNSVVSVRGKNLKYVGTQVPYNPKYETLLREIEQSLDLRYR